MQRHPLPRKRQHRLRPLVGDDHRMQRRIQHRRMHPESDLAPRRPRAAHLGEHLVAAAPHRGQPLKRRTIPIAAAGQPLVNVRHVHRRSRPPAATPTDPRPAGRPPRLNMPSACNTQPNPNRHARRKHRHRSTPDSSAAPTTTCTAHRPEAGNTNGADNISSSTTAQPTSSPARIANSTKPAPGNNTTPATAWSASHGCAASRAGPSTPPHPNRQSHHRTQQRMLGPHQPQTSRIAATPRTRRQPKAMSLKAHTSATRRTAPPPGKAPANPPPRPPRGPAPPTAKTGCHTRHHRDPTTE